MKRPVILGLLALAVTAAPGHAQLGGLKKKIKEQIDARSKPATGAAAPGTQGAAQGAAQNGSEVPLTTSYYTPSNKIPITPAVVDQFLAGLRAEVAERDRIAAAKSTDANVVKFWRRHDRKVYCDSVMKNVDADLAAAQRSMQTASSEAQMNAAVKKITDLNMLKNKGCDAGEAPEMVQSFFDNLRVAETGLDATGASASGLSRGQYAYLRERIAALALLDARVVGPGGSGEPMGYAASEMAAVRARSAALVPLLLRDFIPTGERAPSSIY
jgi:hypothetical protein